MTNTGCIRLTISMAFLLMPFFAMAQNPFSYIPINNALAVSEAVDIVVEPATYTPYFYQGRAEPVAGAKLKLIAIAHREITNGNLTYRWYINNENTRDGQSITIDTPVNSALVVKVEVHQAGKVLATKTESIPLSEMKLGLYEDNALRGLNKVAVGKELIMLGDEVTLNAIPFFKDIRETVNLRTYWKINNEKVGVIDPWKLTLERKAINRDVIINFIMQDYKTLESAEKSFTLKL